MSDETEKWVSQEVVEIFLSRTKLSRGGALVVLKVSV